MELFTPNESLNYAVLEFERAVLTTEQIAIACDVNAAELQVARQEAHLAVTRCRQARNQLSQAIHQSTQQKLLSYDYCPHSD